MTKIFKIRPEAFQRSMRNRIITIVLISIALAVIYSLIVLSAAPIGLAQLSDSHFWAVFLSVTWQTLLIIGIVAGIMIFAVQASAKSARAVWDSFEIEVGDDYLVRRQLNLAETRLERDQIDHLKERGNMLIVYAANKSRQLPIPKSLDGYSEVKDILLSWDKRLS